MNPAVVFICSVNIYGHTRTPEKFPAGKRTYKQTTSLPVGSGTYCMDYFWMIYVFKAVCKTNLGSGTYKQSQSCISSERRELQLYWEYTWSSQSVQMFLFKNTLERFETG